MSSHNEQVQPTPFDVAQPSPAAPTPQTEGEARHSSTPRWVLPALGGLLLLAVLVIFVLPERVSAPDTPPATDTSQSSTVAQDTAAAPTNTAEKTQTPDATPWSEAQAAKLRKEAQEVLAELLEVQDILEERGVQQWATEGFAAATAFAGTGDELYQSREYEQAKAQYQQGLAALQALQAQMPEELARQLQAATDAIEAGDLESATSALELAAMIEPGSPELAALGQRAAVLPQLLPLLEQSVAAEQNRDLQQAQQLLEQAAALDPQHLRVRSELQRVAAAYQQQQFNDAMSDGYSALDEGQFAAARTAFRAAAKLQEGSSEAASALQEVEVAQTAYRLASLKNSGKSLEGKEQWQQAVEAYEKARKIDNNVTFASEGLQRSRGRARLDKQFRSAINDPQRLTDVAVAEATGKLLQQAERITPRGPVLQQQISRLQQLLQQANTPVSVTLRSDEETEVIVHKIARLGRFGYHELTLRPGTYTAVGTRKGYRDVRLNFTIKHDSAPAPVTIACTEPI